MDGQVAVDPLYAPGGAAVPKHRMPEKPMSAEMAYQIVHDNPTRAFPTEDRYGFA